jgi:hypothetical protein
MRYRLLASYRGAPYEAGIGPDEAGVVLFAACPPPEDLQFEPATGHWRKDVRRDDVQMIYESRPVGTFRGERCVVLDDLNERLHIAYLGHDAHLAERLGYWEVDRGVFELITPRHEVTDIVEQRLPLAGPEQGPQMPLGPEIPGEAVRLPGAHRAGLDGGRSSRPRRPDVSIPVVDDAPLPLEAEAMRAASAAVRRETRDQAGRASPRHATGDEAAPGGLAALAAKATAIAEAAIAAEATTLAPEGTPTSATSQGLSEPSTAVQDSAEHVMPSWTPQPHVPPQPPAQAETPGQAAAPTEPVPEPEPTPEPVSAGPSEPGMLNGAARDSRAMPVGVALAAPPPAVTPRLPAALPDQDVAVADPPVTIKPAVVPFASEPGEIELAAELAEQPATRSRRSSRRRQPTQRIFSELAAQAAIPASAYAIGEDIDGAMCLIRTADGFEVFNSLGGARHEVRVFNDEESAYFYLFGVLVADAVRTGLLAPRP